MTSTGKVAVAEFVATFALVFIGAGAVVAVGLGLDLTGQLMAAVEMNGISLSVRRRQGRTLSVGGKIQGAVLDVGKPGLVESDRSLAGRQRRKIERKRKKREIKATYQVKPSGAATGAPM